MALSFLVRFQEEPKPTVGNRRTETTKTATEKEKHDEGLIIPLAGTKTLTEVKREQADQDPNVKFLYAIPR